MSDQDVGALAGRLTVAMAGPIFQMSMRMGAFQGTVNENAWEGQPGMLRRSTRSDNPPIAPTTP